MSVWVAVKCESGHAQFKLKPWVWAVACGWVREPSGVGVGRSEVWVWVPACGWVRVCLVSALVVVNCGSRHTHSKLKSWMSALACGWERVPSWYFGLSK